MFQCPMTAKEKEKEKGKERKGRDKKRRKEKKEKRNTYGSSSAIRKYKSMVPWDTCRLLHCLKQNENFANL